MSLRYHNDPAPKTLVLIIYVCAALLGMFASSQAVEDPNVSPLWGRFYEIKTNRLFFCDRDGIPKYDYSNIDQERSTGYKWYDDWGEEVFHEYKKWSQQWKPLLLPEENNIKSKD